jgi:hypothetical protein
LGHSPLRPNVEVIPQDGQKAWRLLQENVIRS